MKVMMFQVNPTVGDCEGNCDIILSSLEQAIAVNADVALFPEMVTTGYPPRDLLYRQEIWDNQPVIAAKVQRSIRKNNASITAIYGGIEEASLANGHYARYNVAYIVDAKQIRIVRKRLLPCYDVFDETRYFTPGTDPYTPVLIRTSRGVVNCDVLICEDIWNADFRGVPWYAPRTYLDDPTRHLCGDGPVFVLNASPFWHGKVATTEQLILDISNRLDRQVFWCNQIGAHDDIVTGGYSMYTYRRDYIDLTDENNKPDNYSIVRGKAFQTDVIIDQDGAENNNRGWGPDYKPAFFGKKIDAADFDIWCSYHALKLHIQDYFRRCGCKQAVFGCSGGVDSALVGVIAADALGAENVTGITMPSKFSSTGSVSDSQKLAANLGIALLEVPIGDIHTAYRTALLDGGKQEFYKPVTDENIQPRVRGNILFAFSNDYGWLVLTTGNKSEITVGYCTLYGDMAGGLGVIGDLWKTEVYDMCHFINKYRPGLIPQDIIDKAPSAELRPDQKDTDSLPPYSTLDPILKALVEEERPVVEVQNKYPQVDVFKLWRTYKSQEFKRQQMPPTCKLSARAFGSGRRFPIASNLSLARG